MKDRMRMLKESPVSVTTGSLIDGTEVITLKVNETSLALDEAKLKKLIALLTEEI